MPRLLEALSGGQLAKNSCFRGGASITVLFEKGGKEMETKVSAWADYSHASNDSQWLPMAPDGSRRLLLIQTHAVVGS